MSDADFLISLEAIIADRLIAGSQSSYTTRLAREGCKRVAQKVGEEAVEFALASVAGNDDEVLNEAADLMYHALVLLQMRKLRLSDVAAVLRDRHKQSDA